MDKILYATLSVEKGNKKDEVKVYKIKGEKYGIQVESNIDSKLEVNLAENVTSSEEKINALLDNIIMGSVDFKFLEYYAHDCSVNALSV